MSHTPGPWSAFGGRLVRHVVGDRAIPIAESRIPFGSTDNDEDAMEVEAANLRLIAAAPELLEALKGEATEIDGRLCWCAQPNMIKYRGHDGGCESNRELVAKATGEGAR